MAKFCPLFSGSDGNVTYIGGSCGAILIDAGVSYKSLLQALAKIGGDVSEIRAVAVTHEHSDHIKGLKTLLSKNKIPLLASSKTADTLIGMDVLPKDCEIVIADGCEYEFGGMTVSRFATSHDCEGSSGYTVCINNGFKVAVCTDTGVLTEESKAALSGSKAVVIESNHDIEMLKRGPYPPALKMRILSDIGHLSNNACAEFLPELLKSGTDRIVLGHLSKNNNMPMLALSCARATLADIGAENGKDYILKAAKPSDNEVIAL